MPAHPCPTRPVLCPVLCLAVLAGSLAACRTSPDAPIALSPRHAPALPAEAARDVRTRHVHLRTDASPAEAERLAREAEAHAQRLLATYGERLALRPPTTPLGVVAHRRRAAYREALDRVAPGHYGWGAFYDATTRTVHVSTEPAPAGALPVVADLRHEMTHQILDLARARDRGPPAVNLWLWEGFAVHCEVLGDGPGDDTGRLRRERFLGRLARGEVTPLARLFTLGVHELEGRHYDQLASLFAFLMAEGVPGSREATLDGVQALLQGSRSPTAFERRLGMGADALERAWLAEARRSGTIVGFLDSSGPRPRTTARPDGSPSGAAPSRGGE